MSYSSRKGKCDPESDSEITRAANSTTVPGYKTASPTKHLAAESYVGGALAKSHRVGTPLKRQSCPAERHEGDVATPVGLENGTLSQSLRPIEIYFLGLDLLGTHHSFLL